VDLSLLVEPSLQILLTALSLGLISFALGFLAHVYIVRKVRARAEDEAERIVEEAEREAETIRKETRLEAREEIEEEKERIEEELDTRRQKLKDKEEQLHEKEENLEKRLENVYEEIDELKERRDKLDRREEHLDEQQEKVEHELERVSGLTAEEARERLRNSLIEDAKERTLQQVRKIERKAKQNAEAQARRIVAQALKRCAVDETTESTVQVVDLPDDDMKGRIIGRDGRNIRAFEKVAGVDLIVDDTPEAVLISCFNPIRRELAKKALEKLILDGRIQPARIEEIYEKTKEELDESVIEAGEEALSEVGVPGVHEELARRLGQLKYHIEAGQNQLQHAIQVGHISGLIAAELGADADMAKHAGIPHAGSQRAVGKTVDHENGQPYALAGASLLEKYGTPQEVVYAVAAHNEDRDFKTVEGIVVHVAKMISQNKPGARKEKFEGFINRMEKIEDLALQFDGVQEAFAIQAGHELRIVVEEDVIDDQKAEILARDVANAVQNEVEYPDEIELSLLREKRVIDFAR
jgi:ribonuclease Y